MIIFIIVISFLGFCIYALISDFRRDRRQETECRKSAAVWLEKELAAPRYKIRVVTNGRGLYESPVFEPTSTVEYVYSAYSADNRSSLGQARDLIENSIKWGRYNHKERNLFIPMCEIKSLMAVKEGECND